MKVFCLAYHTYDSSTKYYFTGPDNVSKKEFQELCDSLVDTAAYNAIINEKKSEYKCTIDWSSIVELMVPLLKKQGYLHFTPIEAQYSGTTINTANIQKMNDDDSKLSPHVFIAILNFNKQLSKDYK